MRTIILSAVGLAMFAGPLAAENAQSGIAYHERARYNLDINTPAVQVPVRSQSQRFVGAPVGAQQFGLAPGTGYGASHTAGANLLRPQATVPQWTARDRHRPSHR